MAARRSDLNGQENVPTNPVETPRPTADSIISAYLTKHMPEYKELVELRKEGWNNPAADSHFENERCHADNPSEQQMTKFYDMTCRIGDELDSSLASFGSRYGLFSEHSPPRGSISVLDLCMAPGGFSTAMLNHYHMHDVSIHGVTLPMSKGGYEVRIPNWRTNRRIKNIQFLDVTMLASEMGITSPDEIPASHPDKESFILEPLFPKSDHDITSTINQKFDIVFCGGTVVRNHSKTFQSYRKFGRRSEGTRLLTAQLVIAMNHIQKGGTMVVVLHKADTWANVALFHRFTKFCRRAGYVTLFKPRQAHARKGSFYMVARDIDPECAAAREAVEDWKDEWKIASLLTDDASFDEDSDRAHVGGVDGEDEDGSVMGTGDGEPQSIDGMGKSDSDAENLKAAEALLAERGEWLVALTRHIFRIQARALRNAPWGPRVPWAAGSRTPAWRRR